MALHNPSSTRASAPSERLPMRVVSLLLSKVVIWWQGVVEASVVFRGIREAVALESVSALIVVTTAAPAGVNRFFHVSP